MTSDDYQIQFNALNNVTNPGILAQSGQFSIQSGGPQVFESVSVVSGTSTVIAGTSAAEASASATPAGKLGLV